MTLNLVSYLLPLTATESVDLRGSALLAPVLLDPVRLGSQDIIIDALTILDNQIVLQSAVDHYHKKTTKDTYSVLLMDHIIAHAHIRE